MTNINKSYICLFFILLSLNAQNNEEDFINLQQQIEFVQREIAKDQIHIGLLTEEIKQKNEELNQLINKYNDDLAKINKLIAELQIKLKYRTIDSSNQNKIDEETHHMLEQKRLAGRKVVKQRSFGKERSIPEEKNEEQSMNEGRITLTRKQIDRMQEIDALKKRRTDYTKIVTANKCGECHQNEKEVWQKTPHSTGFDLMHKNPRAKNIFKNLGESGSIKKSDRCADCHFTAKEERGKIKAISGVSCESCHGEGKDWLYIHNDKNIPKPERRKNVMDKGMNNPEDIYLIAQNCYKCHSTPDEELVNKGGHVAGSENFEFVRWSQGMLRHNFVRTNNKENAKATPARLRVMFVTGIFLDLEYSLRGLANATQQGPYLQNMLKRTDLAYRRMIAVNEKSGGIKEITELLALFKKLNLKPGNKAEILSGANLITLKAQEFTQNHDGSKLGSLDAVLPKEDTYVWESSRDE